MQLGYSYLMLDDDECSGGKDIVEALCGANAVCYNTEGSFYCRCKEGYMNSNNGSNFTKQENCIDVDECSGGKDIVEALCDANVVCYNTEGSFHCKCKEGYMNSNNGSNFTEQENCADYDECSGWKSVVEALCGANTVCNNTEGSFYCNCQEGYMNLNNKSNFTEWENCTDYDECSGGKSVVEALCGANTVCNNTEGSFYCNCQEGYMNLNNKSNFTERENCTDYDECSGGKSVVEALCGANTVCNNTEGSFYCNCQEGYMNLNNKSNFTERENCTDVDECSGGKDVVEALCGANAVCYNTVGSFYCKCKQGYMNSNNGSNFTKWENCTDSHSNSSSLQDISSFADQFFMNFSKSSKTNSTEFYKSISNFLERMENYAITAALKLHHNEIKTISSESYEIVMQAIWNNTFPKDNRLKLSTTKNSLDIGWSSVTGNGNFDVAAVVLISYKDLGSHMKPTLLEASNKESKLQLKSEIVTVAVTNKNTKDLPEPVNLTIENMLTNETAKCVFWNGSASAWSEHGCEVLEFNVTQIVCSCKHLTSFAVLMALSEIEADDGFRLHMITIFGISFSLVCLLISILTFSLCRSIKSIRTTIHTHLCISLFLADFLFIVGIDKTKDTTVCAVIAGFLHYLFLACFTWMLLEGIQLYLMVVQVFNAKSLQAKYMCLFGYGCPLIVVGISAAVYYEGYGTNEYCWLDLKSGFLWAFLAPVCIIILLNGGFFIITVWKLVNKFSSITLEYGRLKKIRIFTFTAVAQLCLLGCVWISGMLYFDKKMIVMAYIFTVFNSFQGMFIFILHCLLHKQVRDEYTKFFLGVCSLKKTSKYSEFSTSTTQSLKITHETGM
ncbi:adhesion G protein-coupled receptor E3-like isoform X2 [Mobula birostris]|uniref:adhesion G protein-coupled receptor E3-like isoform X2 n=1 Tax=Mobula birostris TaxID=1983395 RepID=UPI003B2852D9